jgi:hypothetical protein
MYKVSINPIQNPSYKSRRNPYQPATIQASQNGSSKLHAISVRYLTAYWDSSPLLQRAQEIGKRDRVLTATKPHQYSWTFSQLFSVKCYGVLIRQVLFYTLPCQLSFRGQLNATLLWKEAFAVRSCITQSIPYKLGVTRSNPNYHNHSLPPGLHVTWSLIISALNIRMLCYACSSRYG